MPETAPQPSAYRKWKVEKYRRYDSTPLSNMLWSEGLTADLLPDYERYDYTDHDQVSESQRKAAYEVILPPERPSRENWEPERLAEYQRDCRVTCWTDGSWDQRSKRGAASSVLQTPYGFLPAESASYYPLLSSYGAELRALFAGADRTAQYLSNLHFDQSRPYVTS